MLSSKERRACRVLSHLKYKGEEFTDCVYNDMLLTFVKYIVHVDPEKLFEKLFKDYKLTSK